MLSRARERSRARSDASILAREKTGFPPSRGLAVGPRVPQPDRQECDDYNPGVGVFFIGPIAVERDNFFQKGRKRARA